MSTTSTTLFIGAPKAIVFRAVSDIANLPNTADAVQRVEFLTEQRRGVGTRFREVRLHRGQEMVTELEVVEFGADHCRMVADSHGTVWDTRFVVRDAEGGTHLDVTMEARPKNPLAWLMNKLFAKMYKREMEKHFVEVRAWCEAQSSGD